MVVSNSCNLYSLTYIIYGTMFGTKKNSGESVEVRVFMFTIPAEDIRSLYIYCDVKDDQFQDSVWELYIFEVEVSGPHQVSLVTLE
jgi:hypothetical protein